MLSPCSKKYQMLNCTDPRPSWEVRTRSMGAMVKSFEQCERVSFTTTGLCSDKTVTVRQMKPQTAAVWVYTSCPVQVHPCQLPPHNWSGDSSDFWRLFVAVSEWFNVLRCPDLFQHNCDFISQMSSHHPRLCREAWRAFRADRKPCYYCVIQPSLPADDSMCAYKRAAQSLIVGTFYLLQSISVSLLSSWKIKLKPGQVQTDRDQQNVA